MRGFWLVWLLAVVAVGGLPGAEGVARADGGTTVTFSYTGALQTWTVPAGVTSVQVMLSGGQGDGTYGGLGARVQATIAVTPGSTLNVYVGGHGSGSSGGFNGGGGGNFGAASGAGGGGSDIRVGGMGLSYRVLVAGGGGGQASGATPAFGLGGSGGGLIGEAGGNGDGSPGWSGGGGGTQSAGGAGGGDYGAAGTSGQGAGGAYLGGDGGGGYYGGGSGGSNSGGGSPGGGGGGSSYATSSASGVSYVQGFAVGNGQVSITYPPSSDNTSPTPGSTIFNYIGAPQLWTVPAGVTSLKVQASGAQGDGFYGGFGAKTTAAIKVVAGQALTVFVGGQGSGGTGGFNGGGGGNSGGASGAGGGASDVRVGGVTRADRAVVAGGGGGGVGGPIFGMGGAGGLNGEAGGKGDDQWTGGGGGTQSAGGAAGNLNASAGSLGQGGGGAYQGGDGGGGYYGGGSGGSSTNGGSPAGGGSGSSYATPGSTGVSFVKGARSGNGQVVLSWPPPAPTVPTSTSTTVNFSYIGAPQYWTVPEGVNMIAVSASGGQGDAGSSTAGKGGSEQGVLPVTPGQILTVMVGGAGSGSTGGFNGGGGSNFGNATGAGGGASDVRAGGFVLADRLLVAGGGGGGGNSSWRDDGTIDGAGGDAGGNSGQAGGAGNNGELGGGGGTQTTGGTSGGDYGAAGVLGQGGGAAYQAGDGGGGYYGGGSGGSTSRLHQLAGGGGGGSSWAAASVNQAATQAAVNTGNGSVTITTGSAMPNNTPLSSSETLGGDNPSEPGVADGQDVAGDGVNTFTGSFSKSFTDLQIPGRGLPLDLERTYNSAAASVLGAFGYGWSFSYAISLTLGSGGTQATISQENGSQVVFTKTAGGSWVAAPRVQASLLQNQDGSWTFTRGNTVHYTLNAAGQLTAEADLNGYATTLSYNGSAQLATVTDPAARTLTLSYWPSGLVQTVSDSGGRSVSYGYDANKNLTSVIDVRLGETDFTYDTGHLLLTLLDPNQHGSPTPHPLTNVYTSGQLITQTDPMLRVTHFDYTTVSGSTIVTGQDGSQVRDAYSSGLLSQQTLGYGTAAAATTPYTYDPANLLRTSQTDPNSHVSLSSYDTQGNTVGSTDPLGNTSGATYNALGQPLTTVDAAGITTTYSYDTAGNTLTKAVTGAGGSPSETTQYTYGDGVHPGDVTELTDPAGYVSDYSYDSDGDRTSLATHPTPSVTNTTTSVFDLLGRVVCRASANATAAGVVCPPAGQPRVANTTTWVYDAAGNVTATTDPQGNPTSYVYDLNGNQTQVTDASTNITKNVYDLDNELTSVTTGFGTASAATTGYAYLLAPGTAPCSASVTGTKSCNTVTDPKGNVTVDYFDALGQQIQETQPSAGITTSSYDPAGNLTGQTTTAGQTTYTYDANDQQRSITYSSPATGYAAAANVTFSYDAAGHRLSMSDGSGTTSYRYDSLGRLSAVINGNGSEVDYAYNNDNAVTDITYPGSNTVHDGYDNAGEPTTVSDWLSHTTNIGYDHNSNPTSEVLPNGDTSTVGFNNDDQLTSISDAPTATPQSPFATFGYTRNPDSLVATEANTGVPAPTGQTYGYDPLNRLSSSTSGGYTYNPGGDPTQLASGTKQTFTNPGQLTAATSPISLIGTASNQSTGTTSLALTLPAGLKASDQILLAVTCANSVNPNTPSGYTVVGTYTSGNSGSSDKVVLYRRTAQTGDTTATVTFGSSSAAVATLAVYRGVNPSSPIDASNFGKATSGTVVIAPSITTTLAGDQLLLIEGAKYGGTVAGSFTQPSGVTARVSLAAGLVLTGAIADQPLTTAGATGTRQVNFSVSSALVAVAVALKPAQTTYGYNSRGDRTSITNPAGTVTNLSYDQADRLVGYGANATYAYNGDGLRTSKTVSGTSEAFTWDSNTRDGIPRPLVDGTTSYVYDPAGHPLEQITSGGTVSYYLHDQLGSTRLLTSSTGTVTASYTYDAYGNLAGSTGSATNPLGYVGSYTDSESVNSYLINRYYDPATATFTTVDPVVSSTHEPYDYAGGDPINSDDPLGTCRHSGWRQVDPSGRCVSRAIYTKSLTLQRLPLISFLQKYDALNTYESKIVFAESSGCTHASELQCYGPSDTEYYGLGQLSRILREKYLPGRITTADPWLQIWAMRKYIQAIYGNAENAWRKRESRCGSKVGCWY